VSKSIVIARVLEGDRLECEIVPPDGRKVTLSGSTSDVEPNLKGSALLKRNRALIHNAWAYAKFTYQKVNLPTRDEQRSAEKSAEVFQEVAAWIADLAASPEDEWKKAWCSNCFTKAIHQKVKRPVGQVPVYLCKNCGSPSLPCAAPGCNYMAIRGRGIIRVPRYCAEHRHDIPGFEKSEAKIDSLEDYKQVLEFDEINLSRATRLAGTGVAGLAVFATAGLVAAPAIGGAVGTLVGGYTGAAASSYGLALLGGGSLAAGGLGMAGGTLVVGAVGGALGCALGASVTNAYVREDKSFGIETLQEGSGVPVIVCNGFLSEAGEGWGRWKNLVAKRYPDSPVYRVRWGAKELKDLGIFAGYGTTSLAASASIKAAAEAATRVGARSLGPIGPVLFATGLAKNPWHVAKSRADKTGVVIADLMARTKEDSFVLVGHSLGARVMAVAIQSLGTSTTGPKIQAAHLTGAAIGAKGDWNRMTARVDDAVYNYFSTNDKVLKYLYSAAMGGQKAAGSVGFTNGPPKLKNIDVSKKVAQHSDYYDEMKLL
jgi:hypothetical protein